MPHANDWDDAVTVEPSDRAFQTVFDRVYKPTADAVLYHYCSTPTLLSILEGGKLRFSDVNMMNDPYESQYGYSLFERAATALLKMVPERPALSGLTTDFFDRVDDYLSPKQLRSHSIITCFSKQPDVLSQWRGYADNAQGWAVGFDGRAIDAMPVTLLDVEYDAEQQLVEVRNFLGAMYLTVQENGGVFDDDFATQAILFSSFLLAYKHPSFREEQEIRAIHELRVDIADDGCELVDEGGVIDGKDVEGQPVQFRAAGSSIIAYVDIPLQRHNGKAIKELWFGPANMNGPGNVLYPLTKHNHRDVSLHHSASTYRN